MKFLDFKKKSIIQNFKKKEVIEIQELTSFSSLK